MQWMIVWSILVGFMATIIYAHGSFNFKVGVTAPYNNLSQRSSFNAWKNMIPRMSLGTSDLGDVGLVNIKKNNNGSADKDLIDWIQNILGTTVTTTTVQPTTPPPQECHKCQCGIANKPNRIVGGHDTAPYQYPWVALLTYLNRFYCAATIINDRYVVTAAHCVRGFREENMRVAVGYHKRNETFHPDGGVYKVQYIIPHAKYSPAQFNNDIALIKIKGTFKLGGTIRPVCFAERGKTFSGENGTVTGWGALSESGAVSNTLKDVIVPILSNDECRKSKYPATRITDNMLCAGLIAGGKDACQGDSGGALHIISNNCHKIVGIVSWGEGCAVAGYPGVYTRFNRYISWIQRNTKDSCYCELSFCSP